MSLTAQQPYNNVVRTALQALSAVLGGTNSLHTNSLDEALALPTAEAATLALRTQQIIAHESGVTNVVDPLGGSYFVERLTLDMEEGAYSYFDDDRSHGRHGRRDRAGLSAARNRRSRRTAFSRRSRRKEKLIVGVNAYVDENETPMPILYIDERPPSCRQPRLARVQATRDAARGRGARSTALREAARGDRQHDVSARSTASAPTRRSARCATRSATGLGRVRGSAVNLVIGDAGFGRHVATMVSQPSASSRGPANSRARGMPLAIKCDP